MTKILAVLSVATLLQININAQYWQQEVNYTIDVTLNDKNHTLRGNLQLEYINHSPEQLSFIWFHLWPNAYKDQKTAFAKQLLKEKDGKEKQQFSLRITQGFFFSVNDACLSLVTLIID